MKKLAIVLLTLILVAGLTFFGSVTQAPAQDVERAAVVTVDQCRADQKLWLSMLELDDAALADVKYLTLGAWDTEMGQCRVADPQNEKMYLFTESAVFIAKTTRHSRFLERHGLWQQFLTEDHAGKQK